MTALQQNILSARFVLTVGHLISILLLLSTIDSNIELSFSDNSPQSDINAALISSKVSEDRNILLLFLMK